MKPFLFIFFVLFGLWFLSGCNPAGQPDFGAACNIESQIHSVLAGLCGAYAQPQPKFLNLKMQQADSVAKYQLDSLYQELGKAIGQ